MSHLLVVAVSIAGLLLFTKFAFDCLEYRNRKRRIVDVMQRLRFMSTAHSQSEEALHQATTTESPPDPKR